MEFRWPNGAIVYHVYPRSLQDSDGDGIGDLKGITSRLDYLKSLSVNAIWLSPFYPSPMADFGYDVADYCAVDPQYGSLDDFKALLSACDERDMRLIIDLVPNHTSDEHAWFSQSRASRSSFYSDWYIWRDPKPGSTAEHPEPPNNWRDVLTGGSAWQWEPQRQQYYLHSFDVKQPDLNWSNPQVRAAMQDVMRFWLDLGIDGFRVDAVYWMAKEPLLSDDSYDPDYVEGEDLLYEALQHDNSRGWPAVYSYLTEMADVLKEPAYQDKLRFMVTEAYPERHNTLAAYMAFYVGVDPKVAAPFNFEGVSLPWEAGSWRKFLKSFHHALEQFNGYCVPIYAFGNHDQPRLVNRLGSEKAARSAAVMLLTLPGMTFIYYGEEIGMHNVDIPGEFVKDPAAKGDPRHGIGRDPERTPMQWDDTRNAGFSTADDIWLPVATDYAERNVKIQSKDPTSFLSLYRTLGVLRTDNESLSRGKIEVVDVHISDVLGYKRWADDGEAFLVLINFSDDDVTCLPDEKLRKLAVSSSSVTQLKSDVSGEITLRGHEAALFWLE